MDETRSHDWMPFTASGLLGGKDWECCRYCGMIRRGDDTNGPCRGRVKVGPRTPVKFASDPRERE